MPKNKNAYLRYLIIHKEIKRNSYKYGYPGKDDILNELKVQGLDISGSQLEKDLRFLRDEKGAPLMYDHLQRCYRYEDEWEFDITLGPEEIKIVRMAMNKLEIFGEAPEFRMVKDSIDRLSDFFNLPARDDSDRTDKYILFEYSKGFRGKEYLAEIYDAIFEKKEISFRHCKYESEDHTSRTLQPYTLKEHRNRWYVIGKENGKPRIFGLDRMSDLHVREVYFIREPEFYDEIFNVLRDAVGVMAFDFESEDVILEFSKEQSYYIKSLMLHRSQQLEDKPDGSVVVRLHVKITPEFITECILKYGDGVKVIQPESLVEQIRTIYRNVLGYYK